MIKTYEEALSYIFKFEEIRDYSLKKIILATKQLGNPQDKFNIIHVAGTSGKGSVSKMLFSVLKKAGKKVGVFTSPHLIDIRERFEINNGTISKIQFLAILNKIEKLKINLSYFEKCVLIALLYFGEKKCEYVILEVGVGGRLDTTNIVNPIITCITSIGYDHQTLLGDTLEEISYEKAGIIKKGIPVVVNFHNKVIEKKAKSESSELIFTNKKIKTNLLGEFQEKNAALAYEITNYLGIDEKIIKNGLQEVKHKGRLEFISENILVDGAHNEDSLKELKKYIEENLELKYKNIYYIFSLKKGKNINLILNIFGNNKNYKLLNIKSEILEDLSCYSDDYEIISKNQVLEEAEKNKKSLYVIFGSLYMIGRFL